MQQKKEEEEEEEEDEEEGEEEEEEEEDKRREDPAAYGQDTGKMMSDEVLERVCSMLYGVLVITVSHQKQTGGDTTSFLSTQYATILTFPVWYLLQKINTLNRS